MPQLVLFLDEYETAIVKHFAAEWKKMAHPYSNTKLPSKHETIRKIIREFGAANGLDKYPLIEALKVYVPPGNVQRKEK